MDNSKFVNITLPDGTYKGFTLNGKRHGLGEFISNQGFTYIGEFYNDFRHGKGCMIFDNGDFYYSNFENGFSNFGLYLYFSGRMFYGSTINYKPHGVGMLFENTNLTECTVLGNNFNFNKKIISSYACFLRSTFAPRTYKKFNDGVYYGTVIDNSFDGFGVAIFNNGDIYYVHEDKQGTGIILNSSFLLRRCL